MGIPIIGDIIGAVKDLAGKAIVDKDKKNEILFKLQELEDKADQRFHEELMGQIEVNKVEAQHPSLFVAGWRASIGWVGASALAYAYIVQPLLGIFVETPKIDLDGLYNIILAMLGIGAMRTYEKVKGVETTQIQSKSKNTAT